MLGTVVPLIVGVGVAYAYGHRDPVTLTTIGAGAITYIVGPITGAAIGASSDVIALSIATGVVKSIMVMVFTPVFARFMRLNNPQAAMVFGGLAGTVSGVSAGLAATDRRLVPMARWWRPSTPASAACWAHRSFPRGQGPVRLRTGRSQKGTSMRDWTIQARNRQQRLARAADLAKGKQVASADIGALLETVIEPGDRVCLEGNNQKQADFLARALAGPDPDKVHDLHMVQSGWPCPNISTCSSGASPPGSISPLPDPRRVASPSWSAPIGSRSAPSTPMSNCSPAISST